MTLFSYEIFDAVARQGSFNKAAQQLHLTPSAISHAIAVMEEELGFALFNRGKNGVSMTSYGASCILLSARCSTATSAEESIARLERVSVPRGEAGGIQPGAHRCRPAAEKLRGALSADRDRSISGHLR